MPSFDRLGRGSYSTGYSSDLGKSWDYGYSDGVHGLRKVSSAPTYSAGFKAGRSVYYANGSYPGKTEPAAHRHQRVRMLRNQRYS